MVDMAGVQEVVYLSTDVSKRCPDCNYFPDRDADFGETINHHLGHGFTVLHVGQETEGGDGGALWQVTVAVLGRYAPPSRQE